MTAALARDPFARVEPLTGSQVQALEAAERSADGVLLLRPRVAAVVVADRGGRLASMCPACGASPGHPCTARYMLTPQVYGGYAPGEPLDFVHAARLGSAA